MKTNLFLKIALSVVILCGFTACLEVPKTDSGTYKGIKWTYEFDTRTLNIKGYGVVESDSSSFYPNNDGYYFYTKYVQRLVVEDDRISAIESGAFWGCESLTSVTIKSKTPPDNYYFPDRHKYDLYVPASSVNAYKNDSYWKTFKSINAIY